MAQGSIVDDLVSDQHALAALNNQAKRRLIQRVQGFVGPVEPIQVKTVYACRVLALLGRMLQHTLQQEIPTFLSHLQPSREDRTKIAHAASRLSSHHKALA
jgi:hypothetical protein